METKDTYKIAKTLSFPGHPVNNRILSPCNIFTSIALSPALSCLPPLFYFGTDAFEWVLFQDYKKFDNNLKAKPFSITGSSYLALSYTRHFKKSLIKFNLCKRAPISFCIKNTTSYIFDCTKLSNGFFENTELLIAKAMGNIMRNASQNLEIMAIELFTFQATIGERLVTALRKEIPCFNQFCFSSRQTN